MNQDQFIRQIEDCQGTVRRFLVALCCGDAALADDIAQDTFVKAYLACDSFREDSKFTSWIFRIAYNTFLSNRRSTREYETLSGNENVYSTIESDSQFEYQALYDALSRLNERERSAILFHYMQGYSVKEIAELTQSSIDAVKQQLSRGRQHLRSLITE
ncbi:MAG: RNA polymerase sigma factor [Muribaculaceae bacterium]|nr:RNA polymerase sigma factor [Muribaculaceae bacterium]